MSPEQVVVVDDDTPLDVDVPWQRLSARMIVVDVVRTLVSLAPSLVAFVLLDVSVGPGTAGALIALAVLGAGGALWDAVRWVTTRYRLTDDHLERSTGLVVRRYRRIRRERIRSVDVDARPRHRVAGLRVVLVGAGQQSAASESALSLDAVRRADAEVLRNRLLDEEGSRRDDGEVLQTFRLWWIVFNVVGVWSLLLAAGVLWGGGVFLSAFGLDPFGWAAELVGWSGLGWVQRSVLVVGAMFGVGIVGMAVTYVTQYWGFELARVPGPGTTQLRTRHGLLRTREVNRDERRLRGAMIAEPVAWRWMGLTDTEVVTTGLSIWSPNQPAAILPRAPRSVAVRVASTVLRADPGPLSTPLAGHPRRALRRRLVWATGLSAALTVVLAYAVLVAGLPWWVALAGPVLWPLALVAAVIAYRALGHGIVGDHAVVRSGLVSRRTVALQRSAVSTVVVRESVLQRRLGLRSVTLATAAGWGGYAAPDLDREEAVEFARQAAPGLLDTAIVEP